MKLQLAKGVRDINPEDKIIKQEITAVLQKNFELYGFLPIETPLIERESVLMSKYTGGEEILKEMFTLRDQGKRKLALRYDLTVPFARYIGMNPQLKIPFKRYQIGKVFRDGPIKLGRYREFWQCDVDIMGCKEIDAEAELLTIASRSIKDLKLNAEIKVNTRKILNGIMNYADVNKDLQKTTILSIDKLEKLGMQVVEKELLEKGLSNDSINKIQSTLNIQGNNKEKIKELKSIIVSEEGKQGILDIENLLKLLENYKTNIVFDISLARGLSYYTGIVFEIFLINSKIKSAIAAGGRYDNMIANLLESKKEFPAVGISFGLDVIADALESSTKKTTAKVYIIPIGKEDEMKFETIKLAEQLRNNDINVSLDLMSRGISKNLNYANSLNIPYVLFIGENEIKENKFKLKNMKTGKEEFLEIKEIVKCVETV
ncbi:MAG: histidine--tRNA ligase [Nanoarchaeota archaeon]|nr:histidine--tRNA ligase [Nanoarchaeota archaeon]